MKIMQIMLSQGFGGAERLFVDCCKAMALAGLNVVAVCHPDFLQLGELKDEKISIYTLKVSFDYSFLAFIRLKAIVRNTSPDVIHTHLCRASLLGGAVGAMERVPVAANIHNYVKLKYYKNISCFIPGTEDQKRYLINQSVDKNKIQVIPHFSLIRSCCESFDVSTRSPAILLSYGRFVKKKGFDILIEALKVVRDSGYNVRLVLGGDGPEKGNLEEKVGKLGLMDCVQFYGWVEDVASFLSLGQMFVLPSLDEPFGIVILEAMSQGNTIISSKAKGPLEILSEKNAWMFDVGKVAAMAEGIIKALDYKSESLEKARSAKSDFDKKYSHEIIVPQYISLFKKMHLCSGQ